MATVAPPPQTPSAPVPRDDEGVVFCQRPRIIAAGDGCPHPPSRPPPPPRPLPRPLLPGHHDGLLHRTPSPPHGTTPLRYVTTQRCRQQQEERQRSRRRRRGHPVVGALRRAPSPRGYQGEAGKPAVGMAQLLEHSVEHLLPKPATGQDRPAQLLEGNLDELRGSRTTAEGVDRGLAVDTLESVGVEK
jgi:hypothetical protein